MKKIVGLICLCTAMTFSAMGQTMEELKSTKAEKSAAAAELQGQVDAINGEIAGIDQQILLLSGWRKGINGLIGYNFNSSNQWLGVTDSKSVSLNFGVNAFANKQAEKYFWNNKGIISKSWQVVNKGGVDSGDLFDNSVVDLVNISSLFGYKLSDKFALSALGEFNTSIEDFFDPGTLDIGVGVTWTPIANLTVVIHPLNYHYAFSGTAGLASTGSVGAKVRADYNNTFKVNGKDIVWSSTLTTFLPYKEETPTLFEWTFINNFSFTLWKGIGVGFGIGIRNAEFEYKDTQSYFSIGLSYAY